MIHLDDAHEEDCILNLVNDPVCTLAHAVSVRARELLRTVRTRIIGKLRDSIYDEPTGLLGRQILNLAGRGAPDLEAISCHAASDLARRARR